MLTLEYALIPHGAPAADLIYSAQAAFAAEWAALAAGAYQLATRVTLPDGVVLDSLSVVVKA